MRSLDSLHPSCRWVGVAKVGILGRVNQPCGSLKAGRQQGSNL
jgi:hypothetical protein